MMIKAFRRKFSVILASLMAGVLIFSACGPAGGTAGDAEEAAGNGAVEAAAPAGNGAVAEVPVDDRDTPEEGPDTNNGRPFNLRPMAWDNRDTDRFLHGINATVLPIAQEPVEIEFWRGFGSTIMTSLNESEVFEEAARRTNITINWSHPPEGQADENFAMRIAADDLPHVFIHPPAFPGGNMAAIEQGVYLDLTPFYNLKAIA